MKILDQVALGCALAGLATVVYVMTADRAEETPGHRPVTTTRVVPEQTFPPRLTPRPQSGTPIGPVVKQGIRNVSKPQSGRVRKP